MSASDVNVTVNVTVNDCACDHDPAPCDTGPAAVRLHFGAPRSTTPEERQIAGSSLPFTPGRITVIMDLKADQELPLLDPTFTDEVGNPVPAPAGATTVYSSGNEASVVIATADDGLTVARSTGTLGDAVVHADITWTDADGGAHAATADALVSVVAGDAERATITFGEAREVTPDV